MLPTMTRPNTFISLLHKRLHRWKAFAQLARINRPIGIYLLLWPTLCALWLAARGIPSTHNLLVFVAGVILTRSAGCVINDYADRHFDGGVSRTLNRPLIIGSVTPKEALLYAATMFLVAFLLVLTTNSLAIWLSFSGVLLACTYPLAKRYTYLPQVVLGAAFSWAIPMAYAAETGALTIHTWLLFTANLLWVVAYDTQYAMTDREDDLKVGIKSTAILFGNMDNVIIAVFQAIMLTAMLMLGMQLKLGLPYYLSLLVAAGIFVYQQKLTRRRDHDYYFKAFISNHWVGLVIFLGVIFSI